MPVLFLPSIGPRQRSRSATMVKERSRTACADDKKRSRGSSACAEFNPYLGVFHQCSHSQLYFSLSSTFGYFSSLSSPDGHLITGITRTSRIEKRILTILNGHMIGDGSKAVGIATRIGSGVINLTITSAPLVHLPPSRV
jgi:hypothetical protein